MALKFLIVVLYGQKLKLGVELHIPARYVFPEVVHERFTNHNTLNTTTL